MATTGPWGAVEPLLLAVGARDEQLAAAVADVGFGAAADAAVAELRTRYEPAPLSEPVVLHLCVQHGELTADYTVQVGAHGLTSRPGVPAAVAVTVTYDLLALLRGLFGPRGGRRPGPPGVRITWPELGGDIPALAKVMGPVVVGIESLLAACSSVECDLGRLAVRFGSDKWGGVHWYTRHYDHHFGPLRDEPVRLLEIGVGGYSDSGSGGGSLRMWERYFRRGLIHGLDLYRKPEELGPRVRTLQGDQNDARFLAGLAAELGPFDIVVDDGSHVNEHVRTSFEALFPHVRDGGLYVIEDAQTSYWPGYGGDPDELSQPTTTLGLMKSLVDLLHHRELEPGSPQDRSYAADHTVGVHFYHNLVFVEKGRNDEEATPAWIPRDPF